ncbi:MAG: hypothetical protein U5K37_01200 [Natrialbaceae archaeon]|nr:hypothetical protein [Natrialbaceae archaeon]
MTQVSFRIDQELLNEIDGNLTYGDTRTGWFEGAAQIKLALSEEIDGFDEMTTQEQIEAVRSQLD